jgi:hypothetical protein
LDATLTKQKKEDPMTNKLPTTDKPKRPLEVRGKLAEALDLIAYQGTPYDEAARKAGLTVRAMRMALAKPHVIRYLRTQRQVLLASMSGANVLAMAQVRSQTENQNARVGAVKQLEAMSNEQTTLGAGQIAPTAGFVIVLQVPAAPGEAAPAPLIIDALPGHARASQTEMTPGQGGNGGRR